MVIGGLVHRIRELQRADVKDECTRLRNVSQGVFLSVVIRLGPMLMQSIGGLPSVRNDENHNGIEFWALLTQDGSKLNLAIARSWERIASRVDLDFLTPRTRRMLLYPNPLFLIIRASGSALPASASLLGWAYGPVRPRLGEADRV